MGKFKDFYKHKFLNLTVNWFCDDANDIFKIKVKELDVRTRKQMFRNLYGFRKIINTPRGNR